MSHDPYDDPMLEEWWIWFSRDEINDIKLFAKIVAVPTGLFIALQVFNYYINKKD